MNTAPSLIRPPMHAFRPVGKFIEHARAASQSHPDLLRLPEPPLMDRFLLARVCEPVAVTAGEQSPHAIQFVTRRPQYTPFEATEHTNQGRSPPNRHGVHAAALTRQVQVALFMDGKLHAGAFEHMSSARRWRNGRACRSNDDPCAADAGDLQPPLRHKDKLGLAPRHDRWAENDVHP